MKLHPDNHRCIGLVANPDKASCRPAVARAMRLIRATGRVPVLDAATAALVKCRRSLPTPHAVAAATSCVLVFGGDGTILRMARDTAGLGTPLLGINVGNLGFLTAATTRELPAVIKALNDGHCLVEKRPLIQASLQPASLPPQLALNDFVIARAGGTRLIEIEVAVNGERLTRYRCDGLIVSSPTGSTAYSLAAGGAIITPDSEVFALTPICPHTLSNRPVILSLSSTITVRILDSHVPVQLSADGQVQTELAPDDQVVIRRSRKTVALLRLRDRSFFTTLQHKLRWSGSPV